MVVADAGAGAGATEGLEGESVEGAESADPEVMVVLEGC